MAWSLPPRSQGGEWTAEAASEKAVSPAPLSRRPRLLEPRPRVTAALPAPHRAPSRLVSFSRSGLSAARHVCTQLPCLHTPCSGRAAQGFSLGLPLLGSWGPWSEPVCQLTPSPSSSKRTSNAPTACDLRRCAFLGRHAVVSGRPPSPRPLAVRSRPGSQNGPAEDLSGPSRLAQ